MEEVPKSSGVELFNAFACFRAEVCKEIEFVHVPAFEQGFPYNQI